MWKMVLLQSMIIAFCHSKLKLSFLCHLETGQENTSTSSHV
jgi:hypothetical protein